MSEKTIFGHIDCPTCGTEKGMRITHDKNGDPFGYCEAECNQQMRIGGDKRRVKSFLARYPWAAPVTDTASAPEKAEVKHPPAAQEPVPVQKPKPRSSFDDAVNFLSGGRT